MKWAVAALLVLALVGLGIKWVIDERARTAPATPTVHVQSAWEIYREAPGHQKHVGEMALDCQACHQMVDGGADHPGAERCASCHEAQADLRHGIDDAVGSDGGVVRSDCTACHGFGPDPQKQPGDCLDCHAEAQGDLEPVTVHASEDCLSCHEPHEDRARVRACAECHQVNVRHGQAGEGGAGAVCTTCHAPHAEAEVASQRCGNCHGAEGILPVPATAGHADRGCAACHSEHRFTRETVARCGSCHEDTHVLPGAGHARCTSCHDPHALSPSTEAVERCSECHRDVQPRHGDPSEAVASGAGPTQCIECHVAHPVGGITRNACTDCHALARTETLAHAGDVACGQCHRPHLFDSEAATPCKSCHGARLRQMARHPGHSDCSTCHDGLPHLAGQPPQACGNCHEAQQTAVIEGHAECLGCHAPHATDAPRVACAGCHQEQASNVGPGHAACASCHDTHSGAMLEGVSDCSSCHDARRMPGLHGVPQHQRCADCHSVHGEQQPATRETCTGTCHTEQRDHQPAASACSGCHTFRAPGARRKR